MAENQYVVFAIFSSFFIVEKTLTSNTKKKIIHFVHYSDKNNQKIAVPVINNTEHGIVLQLKSVFI